MPKSEYEEIERQFAALGLGTEEQRSQFLRWAITSESADAVIYVQRVANTDGGPLTDWCSNA